MKNYFYSSQNNETELTKLESIGNVPDWISGKLLRNGPAKYEVGNTKFRHFFDGLGMIHGFNFEKGEIYYHSKFIKSKNYLSAQKDGVANFMGWATPSNEKAFLLKKFITNLVALADNTCVNIIKVGKKYFTTSDNGAMNEIDSDSLETIGLNTILRGGILAAHPSFTEDKKVWNMKTKFGPKAKNTIISFSEDEKYITHKEFMTDKVFYFHSFGNTDRYFIVIEQPMYLSFKKLFLSGFKNTSYYECFDWDNNAKNIFHIYDRESGELIKIQSKYSFFFFHIINSYKKDEKIYIDLPIYDDNSIIDSLFLDKLEVEYPEQRRPKFAQITIDLQTKEIVLRKTNTVIELTSINYTLNSKEYNYTYGIHSSYGSNRVFESIIKYDVKNEIETIWKEKNLIIGEPIFIKEPGKIDEDDGVVLVVCYDEIKGKTCLVILNAKDMKEISRSYIPTYIPASLHGMFYKNK